MARSLSIALLCLLSALAGFGLGHLVAGRGDAGSGTPAEASIPVEPVPGERSLELAQIRRVELRLSATDSLSEQLPEANSLLRNRLAAAGLTLVGQGEPSDAVVTAHLDSHHFSAFDAHAVAVELRLSGRHQVRVGGDIRLIPHDIWQSDTFRLVQPELIPREAVQSLDELSQYLLAAVERARAPKR